MVEYRGFWAKHNWIKNIERQKRHWLWIGIGIVLWAIMLSTLVT